MDSSSSECRVLIPNSMTYNQIEIFFCEVLSNLIDQMQEKPTVHQSLEEHINEIFGRVDDIYMDIRDPETLLSILRIDHNDLYNQLFLSTVMVIKTIIQQFAENNRLPIEPITISQPFLRVFQHLYPKKFNIGEFRTDLQNIPYYMKSIAVRQNTNAFLLTVVKVFCTTEHYLLIESVLLIII
jgi:hypothetical protein